MPTVDPTKPNVPPLIAEDFNSIPEFNRPNREWLVRFGCIGLHTSGWFFWTLGLLGDPLWGSGQIHA
jgi:hypothetical protein